MNKKLCYLILTIILVCFVGISCYTYFYNENHVSVLGYHGVLPSELNIKDNEFTIDLETFDKQLKFLNKYNYKTLTMKEFLCWKERKCSKPHKAVLITFDDGYKNNYDYAFALLKKYNMYATVFYVGEYYKGENQYMLSLEDIKKSSKEYPNIEFASHSYKLHNHNVKTYKEVDDDIKFMNTIVKSKYYAYPHGEYNKQYIKALQDNGYKLAFTFGPGKEHKKSNINDNNYKIPRLNISKQLSLTKFEIRLALPLR